MAINIDIIADVKKFLSGTQDMEGALNDVADELDQLADASVKAAKKSEDALEDAFTDGTKDAQKSLEKLEDSIDDVGDSSKSFEKVEDALEEVEDKAKSTEDRVSDAFREMAKKAGDSGSKIGKSQKDGFDNAKKGVEEFGDEANSTARESAASFDGSAEGIVDSFQEIAANAFAGFGPAGAAAGLAAAVGIGIAVTKLQDMAEANDEAKEKMGELAQEIYETGGAIDDAALKEKIEDIAFSLMKEDVWYKWGDQARSGAEVVQEALDGIDGVDAKKVFEGLAGDVESGQEAFDQLTRSVERDEEALKDMYTTTAKGGSVLNEEGEALQKSINRRKDLRGELEESVGASQDATSAVEYYTEVMGDSTASIEERIEAEQKLKEINLSAAESEIALAESADELTQSFKDNGKTIDINTEKGRNNRSAILDHTQTLGDWAQSQIDAGADVGQTTARMNQQKEALINQVAPFFGSKEAARKYIEQVLKTPHAVSTDVNLDGIPDAEQDLNHLTRDRATKINVGLGSTYEVDNYILGKQGTKIYVDFAPRGGRAIT